MEEKRVIRHFSEAFKKEKVRMIESRQITVRQLSRIYQVSQRAVYNWLKKYSMAEPATRIVVEKESEGAKALELMKQIAELEQAVGRKQLKIDYLERIIEVAGKEAGLDIKKKYSTRCFPCTGKTVKR